MPKIGMKTVFTLLSALIAVGAMMVVGCGGGSTESEKNVKPGQNISDAAKEKLKELQADYKPKKKTVDEEDEAPAKTNGTKKKGATKKAAGPSGLIIRKNQ